MERARDRDREFVTGKESDNERVRKREGPKK